MELETERLLIREFKPSDHKSIHEYSGNPHVVKYMPFDSNTLEQAKAFLEQAMNKQSNENRTDFELAIVLKNDNKLIGGCRINKETSIMAHIGYMLNQDYWGHGYATEVAKALVAYGFTEMDVHRIYATCVPENTASWRVLEKAGLVREGRLRESMMSQGNYCDAYVFGILKHEWNSD